MLLVRTMTSGSINGHDTRTWEILCSEGAGVNREDSVQGQESLSNLGVRVGVKVPTLGIAEELVKHIVGTFAIVIFSGGGLVAHVITATAHGLVVHRASKGGLRVVLIITTCVAGRMRRLAKGGRVSTDLTIVIVIARRSYEAN